jgi:cytochrome c peroxidase
MQANVWTVLAVTTMLPAIAACTERAEVGGITAVPAPTAAIAGPLGLDADLQAYLSTLGFTGRMASTLEARLGRRVDQQVAEVGRMLWFDPIGGLNDDNTCGGCHSPTNGFGDTQSIAIGIDNNGIVGSGANRPAQSAALADGDQHGVLPDTDVELALQRALG